MKHESPPLNTSQPLLEQPVLSVSDLHVHYALEEGQIFAVNGVSFDVARKETFAIVGESGSGKSTVALSLLGLAPIANGKVNLDGIDLAALDAQALGRVRGRQIAMIFQEPSTSLNPVLTVGFQIMEAIRTHQTIGRAQARSIAVEMLEKVGISDPDRRIDQYPHELSGGMRQRVMIAMALSCKPQILVADEPTTALDVTVQAQILDLIDTLREEFGTAVVLITHDIGVVAETADRVAVMYAGQIVELAPTLDLFDDPRHPYTQGLLASVLRIDKAPDDTPLAALGGSAPSMRVVPEGCRFKDRCVHAMPRCDQTPPLLEQGLRSVRCWLYV